MTEQGKAPSHRNSNKVGNRRSAREAALQMLYLCDNCGFSPEEAHDAYWMDLEKQNRVYDFANELFLGIWKRKSELDELITTCAKNWVLDRMAVVDRNILRLAAFEIVNMPETPISVVINEAVEIAKLYSTPDSGKFVNGILDKMKTERKPLLS